MSTSALHMRGLKARLAILVLCLTVCFFMASIGAAAEIVSLSNLRGGGSFVFAGIDAESIDWELLGEPKGPHGGYRTTSQKCITCHSAHGAVASNVTGVIGSSMTINRSSTGCAFCHTLGAPAAPNGTPAGMNPATDHVWVYTATQGRTDYLAFDQEEATGHRLGDFAGVPASSISQGFTLTCSTCHLIHGSTTNAWKPTDLFDPNAADATNEIGYKFLRNNPAGALRASSDPLRTTVVPNTAGEATNLYQTITGDPQLVVKEVNQFTLSVWCASCHDYALNPNRPKLDDGSFSEADTFMVSGDYLNSIHPDPTDDKSLADGYATGYAHTVPMQGAYMSLTGSMECYSCHRANLTSEGTTPAGVASGNAKCARCHYGYANYAVDANRFGNPPVSDFPHSATGAHALLGDFILDGTDPYAIGALKEGDDLMPSGKTVTETLRHWESTREFRTNVCGRCHAYKDSGEDGGLGNDAFVEFTRSYHWPAHMIPDEWILSPHFNLDDLFSPGVGTP